MNDTQVKAWEENIVIPTYPTGEPEKNPMFLEKRVYQGSSGVVFPHAVIEKIIDQKIDRIYRAVFLENKYLKIMLLPELGGRIQMAFDKTRQRHFIYYNQVIKPALVGLTGPWISGGIEFNWPQHHRPSTFEPVDHSIRENPDGSKTVWIHELERMTGTKGLAGFTLYPDKAYLEISGKLYNRTPFPQTFLWWANPAVKVNDHYQSVFPPDVYAVFDHGKRDVSAFPIAKGVYYKVNYAPGTDISRYRNIPVPTSYMANPSKYNFVGGYEHDTRAGILHIADHHISPGKKQWTWGNGDFGKAWDRNLTDEDGPYAELMTGIYTDNQPDFSWLNPYEEKTFLSYFLPYKEVGMVKNATKEALVNLEWEKDTVDIRLYVTAPYQIRVSLYEDEKEIFGEEINSDPATAYHKKIQVRPGIDPCHYLLSVVDLHTKKILVAYQPDKPAKEEYPSPAQAANSPEETLNNEQLFLTGLHIEQYRHATYNAADYYREALRRDEKDIRNNNALGLWLLRRGKFVAAEPFFRQAITGLTARNPNPYDGEAYYNLGLSLKMQGRNEEAFDAFYKSIWNDAWQHAGFLNLARIATARRDPEEALHLIDRSLIKNYHSHTARHLKSALLRKLGQPDQASTLIDKSLTLDPFNFGCLNERILLMAAAGNADQAAIATQLLLERSRNWVHNLIETTLDYAQAGLFEEAKELLLLHESHSNTRYPMTYYYLGWCCHNLRQAEAAGNYFRNAASLDPALCFSNRIEDVPVLTTAIEYNPDDAKAPYYLGNFWYDKRQYADAITCWERSVGIDDRFPTAHRNLALAYYNKQNNPAKALASMETAFALDHTDARVFMELDQLYKRMNRPVAERLALMEEHLSLIRSRDDLYLEYITLYNQSGKNARAKELIASRQFHPWEGGEGKVAIQYGICCLELAKQAIEQEIFKKALSLLEEAENYPINLGEGKLLNAQENDIFYLKGLAFELSGKKNLAEKCFQAAVEGFNEPAQAIFYNDPQPDKIFYQGLAWVKLNDRDKADSIFHKLIDFGKAHLNDTVSIDYFAVSLPDLQIFDADLSQRNHVHCLYMIGLGYLGLGNDNLIRAEKYFNEALVSDINHQGAAVHLQLMKYMSLVEIR